MCVYPVGKLLELTLAVDRDVSVSSEHSQLIGPLGLAAEGHMVGGGGERQVVPTHGRGDDALTERRHQDLVFQRHT